MANYSVGPELLVEYRAHRREADKLLGAGQYDRVAALLLNFQKASETRGDAQLAQILKATRHICLACRHCHSETEWRRQAYLETRKREQELQRDLQAILDSIGRLEFSAGMGTRHLASAASTDHIPISERASLFAGNLRRLLKQSSADPVRAAADPDAVESQAAPQATAPLPRHRREPASGSKASLASGHERLPRLLVYCLGPFQVYHGDSPIEDWPNGKGKSIFKYLVTHRERPVSKEILMDLFWPNAEAHAARNNLNVAIYGLRHAISKVAPCQSHVLFRDDHYLLNPELHIWVDHEDFSRNLTAARDFEQEGDEASALQCYRTAEALYQGEFLEEDRYEDWLAARRQQLKDSYLDLLDRLYRYDFDRQCFAACATLCGKMLAIDRCHEKAHRRLMRCYSKQGQPYLALRQFQTCKRALARELDVLPSKPTLELYEKIRHQQPV